MDCTLPAADTDNSVAEPDSSAPEVAAAVDIGNFVVVVAAIVVVVAAVDTVGVVHIAAAHSSAAVVVVGVADNSEEVVVHIVAVEVGNFVEVGSGSAMEVVGIVEVDSDVAAVAVEVGYNTDCSPVVVVAGYIPAVVVANVAGTDPSGYVVVVVVEVDSSPPTWPVVAETDPDFDSGFALAHPLHHHPQRMWCQCPISVHLWTNQPA